MSEHAAPGLEPGDVVRLKSGGPTMTVQIVGGELAYCVWFQTDQPATTMTGAFLTTMLQKVTDGVSGS